MLRASRRLLKPSGGTGYFTIVMPPNLSKAQHRRAVRLGPRAIASLRPMDEMMKQAGFERVHTEDVTEDFLQTARAWVSEFEEHEQELRTLPGVNWDERQNNRRGIILGIEQGLLLRILVTGSAS